MFYYFISSIDKFLQLLEMLIFVDAIMSFVIRPRSNSFSKILGLIVDPVIKPCQMLQKKVVSNSPVDFSPLMALILIELLRRILFTIFL
jgi:YggT family protein